VAHVPLSPQVQLGPQLSRYVKLWGCWSGIVYSLVALPDTQLFLTSTWPHLRYDVGLEEEEY